MATQPGILSEWPWQKLGNYKYSMFLPYVAKAVHANFFEGQDADNFCFWILLLTALRYLLCQLWMTAARLRCIVDKYQVQEKGVKFPQVDRERGWDDFFILNVLVISLAHAYLPGASNVPLWNSRGIVIVFLAHAGPTEFIYYWAHRLLHHHFLFTRYHSHHHASIVTEPITGNVHPFIEHVFYAANMGISMAIPALLGQASVSMVCIYLLWFDFMNCVGHCNWEFVPPSAFKLFPPLKYLMYTASYHSLHHTRVHTNFSLFMPLYDYLYGTADKSSDSLYSSVRQGRKVTADVVHLSHTTSLLSCFHQPFAFASLSAQPFSPRWYLWLLWPLALPIMLLMWAFGSPYTADKYVLRELRCETWMIPRYTFHYFLPSEKKLINRLIEECIAEAEKEGIKVISLGLLNKKPNLNRGGELIVETLKDVKVRVVTGNTLIAAATLNGIGSHTKIVFLTCPYTMTGRAIVGYLSRKGVRVLALMRSISDFKGLLDSVPEESRHNIVYATKYQAGSDCKTWIVGEHITADNQKWAPPRAVFHQITMFQMQEVRKDCAYKNAAAMHLPGKNLEGLRFCEGALPRGVVDASHAAGILHALEGWQHHDVGEVEFDNIETTWEAAAKHGFAVAA